MGISDVEVMIQGYRTFRGDRTEDSKKGGIAVYVREHLAQSTYVVTTGSNGKTEYVILYNYER